MSDLPPDAPESAHLAGVVGTIPAAGRMQPSLWKNLIAYAYFLEHDARLEESLEVLSLAARAQGERISASDFAAYALFAGRLNRQLARWECGHPVLRCRRRERGHRRRASVAASGTAWPWSMLHGPGKLPAARDLLDTVLKEATELGLPKSRALPTPSRACSTASKAPSREPGSSLSRLPAHRRSGRADAHPRRSGAGVVEIGAYDVARIAFEIVASSQARVSGPDQCRSLSS